MWLRVSFIGLGFKEIWQVDESKHQLGKVVHGTGWPLSGDTGGGAFMYHSENNQAPLLPLPSVVEPEPLAGVLADPLF